MTMQIDSYSPEHNEGLLTPEYLQAIADDVPKRVGSVEVPVVSYEIPTTPEQKLAEAMAAQKVSIAKNAELINRIYQRKLIDDRQRYLEKHRKGIFVGKVIGYIFDDVLKFPTSEPRPAVTMMDVHRQAGRIGGTILPSGMGEVNYFWYSPDAANDTHKGEFVFMQMYGGEYTSHIHYPVIYDETTGRAEVTKFISRDLTSDKVSEKLDAMPNQYKQLDREELFDLAVTVDALAGKLSTQWGIQMPETRVDAQAVGQVYNFVPRPQAAEVHTQQYQQAA